VKVAMDCHAEAMAHAGHGAERVRPRAEVGHFAQVFERRALLLDWIPFRVVYPPDDVHGLGLELDGLSQPLALGQHAGHRNRAPGGQLLDLALVVGQRAGGDHLERIEARAVVHVDERNSGFGVAARPNPATNRHRASCRRLSLQYR
jgi:hypothetical protein